MHRHGHCFFTTSALGMDIKVEQRASIAPGGSGLAVPRADLGQVAGRAMLLALSLCLGLWDCLKGELLQ